ncbi:ASCH domain-containing protein [Algoriphagus jejuensis]|uniref:ASCH domain-containing protein n=1 Tax=Algoriphagus jejuensis TaxID=419934 RepID=A0ABN1N0J7_9BACT
MKVLLSIKPEFAEKIFDGTKRFEFRRRIYKNEAVKSVIVYASAPISKVIGEFEIETVHHDELDSLWDSTVKFAGISEEFYREYFNGKESGYAIEVKSVRKYREPLGIRESFGIGPPQSFAYVDKL